MISFITINRSNLLITYCSFLEYDWFEIFLCWQRVFPFQWWHSFFFIFVIILKRIMSKRIDPVNQSKVSQTFTAIGMMIWCWWKTSRRVKILHLTSNNNWLQIRIKVRNHKIYTDIFTVVLRLYVFSHLLNLKNIWVV